MQEGEDWNIVLQNRQLRSEENRPGSSKIELPNRRPDLLAKLNKKELAVAA
jgi:hypothetical protein